VATTLLDDAIGGTVIVELVDLQAVGPELQRPLVARHELKRAVFEHRRSNGPHHADLIEIDSVKHSDPPELYSVTITPDG
jgi:hypothetical protein